MEKITKEAAMQKYDSLALAQLKVWAKQMELKLPANAKKSEVIDALIAFEIKSGNIIDDNGKEANADADKVANADKKEKTPKASKIIKDDKNNKTAKAGKKVADGKQKTADEKISDENVADKKSDKSAEKDSRKKNSDTKENKNAKKVSKNSRNAGSEKKSDNENPVNISVETEVNSENASEKAEQSVNVDADKLVIKETQQVQATPAENAKPENTRRMAPSGEEYNPEQDTGKTASGILEVMSDGFGFIRCENFLPGDHDVYVSPSQIKRFGLRTGDILEGNLKHKGEREKFQALLYLTSINGMAPLESTIRLQFENMTPIFPDERIKLAVPGAPIAMRIMDLLCPVGKGQRGMIVSPPKAGKTTLLKSVAKSVKVSNPNMHMIILLIDERPEEVTDIKEEVMGPNVEVIYSTFDETPEHHKRVSEMAIERARRLVEYKKDVIILLDSITRLTRAYNQVVPPSGRTLSGGLDPAALHMPKRFYGAARNMREGGSLTILATALVETGSKMDDVVYEEFKGTGNMEIVLDRKLSERRVFPAIDIPKSGTRRDDLLLSPTELEVINTLRRSFNEMTGGDAVDKVLDMFSKTQTNEEFINYARKMRY